MTRQALGKGIEALIPEIPEEIIKTKKNLADIEIDKIKTNPYQPRINFDEEKLKELALSIKEKGMIQPVVVRRKEDGFELVAGERRLKAAEKIGMKLIPALIMENLSKGEMLELTLIENVQREDLNPIEEAKGYKRLLEECGLSQKELSKKISKDRSSIANTLRLLNLPIEIQNYIGSGKISEGHARAILAVNTTKEQIDLANKVIKFRLSVREIEKLVYEKAKVFKKKLRKTSPSVLELEERLIRHFGTKVKVIHRKNKGKIEIEFYSEEDLQRILDLLNLRI
jgi:ParB family chromosome partitioning protein